MSYEENLVEEFLKEIKTDGKFSYGFNEVKKSTELGAVRVLIISSEAIKQKRINDTFEDLDLLIGLVEKMNGDVVIISSENNAGEKLDSLTGIGAILRYKIE